MKDNYLFKNVLYVKYILQTELGTKYLIYLPTNHMSNAKNSEINHDKSNKWN